jgi:hypothetical protein
MKLLFTIVILSVALTLSAQTSQLRYDAQNDILYLGDSEIALEGLVNLTEAQGSGSYAATKANMIKQFSILSIKPNTFKNLSAVFGAAAFGTGFSFVYSANRFNSFQSSSDFFPGLSAEALKARGYAFMVLSAPFIFYALTKTDSDGYKRRYERNILKAVKRYNESISEQ